MSETISCSHCGAEYEVTYTKTMFRDRDSEDCEVCGEHLASWNGSNIPHYRLIKRPDANKKPAA